MKRFLKYLLVVSVAAACDDDDGLMADRDADFFPLETGLYWEYGVVETRYETGEPPNHSEYRLRVEVTDSFPNTDGTLTWVLLRSKSIVPGTQWMAYDTWSVIATKEQVVVREGNIPFVKMLLGASGDVSWDGNRYNNLGKDVYQVVDKDMPFSAGGTNFDKTLTVLQEDNGDVIVFYDKRREVYARSIGLIYRETKQLHYCTEDHCRAQQKVEHGVDYTQELIAYGRL